MFFYGPFKRNGAHTAPSNVAFDESLRTSNPEWGVRDLSEIEHVATTNHLVLSDVVEMPANNLVVQFTRR